MSKVRKYHVTHNGHQTIMRLNDQDVKAYPGARLVDDPSVEPPPTPEPTPEPESEAKPAAKTRTASDKARLPAGDK